MRMPEGMASVKEPCIIAQTEGIQTGIRSQFERRIAEGRAAVGFEFDAEQGSYVLEAYED